MKTKVDIIVPVYNEETELGGFLENMAQQTTLDGSPLPIGAIRVIVVNNGSTDGTFHIFNRFQKRNPEMLVEMIDESEKSHIAARITGGRYALQTDPNCNRPLMISADVDTRFPLNWVAHMCAILEPTEHVDVAISNGWFPDEFWLAMPRAVECYLEEIGSLFFSPRVVQAVGATGRRVLFNHSIYKEFTRMPSDCGFAMRKSIYHNAGGYVRHFRSNGEEILGEGWNLRFALDQAGARIALQPDCYYQTSPRRLIFEAVLLLEGEAYLNGMSDLRELPTAEHAATVESHILACDFVAMRNYVVRNYILLPCLSSPQLLANQSHRLGKSAALISERSRMIHGSNANPHPEEYYAAAEELTNELGEIILERFRCADFRA
jgi:glycosyltransferase involved in cell wall biosynthesis